MRENAIERKKERERDIRPKETYFSVIYDLKSDRERISSRNKEEKERERETNGQININFCDI